MAGRVRQAWAAWKKGDAAAYAALTTEDYREVAATGTLHFYRFTSQELAAFPITQFYHQPVASPAHRTRGRSRHLYRAHYVSEWRPSEICLR